MGPGRPCPLPALRTPPASASASASEDHKQLGLPGGVRDPDAMPDATPDARSTRPREPGERGKEGGGERGRKRGGGKGREGKRRGAGQRRGQRGVTRRGPRGPQGEDGVEQEGTRGSRWGPRRHPTPRRRRRGPGRPPIRAEFRRRLGVGRRRAAHGCVGRPPRGVGLPSAPGGRRHRCAKQGLVATQARV